MLLKNKFIVITLFFSPVSFTWSQTSIVATVNSELNTKINAVNKLRHSGDCYWFRQPDQYKDLGQRNLKNTSNTFNISQSSTVTWLTHLTEPYTAVLRKTHLHTNILNELTETQISLSLSDHFTSDLGVVSSSKCSHVDAMVYSSNTTFNGSIEVHYKMPENTWLVQIDFKDISGAFSEDLEINSTLSQKLLTKSTPHTRYVWGQPGEEIRLKLFFLNFTSGIDLGKISIKIQPIGAANQSEMSKTFLDQLLKNQDLSSFKVETMLAETMRLNSMPAEVRSITKKFSLYEIKKISDIFWHYAMQNFTDQIRGLDIKNAAALAALNFAHIFLEEVDVYCSNITYQTPLTDHKQNINLMHAIGFWLNRIYLYTETYSYEPFIVFFQEMDKIQKRGLSPDQVTADPILRNQVQDSYLLLREELVARGSLFNRTHTDIVRILKHQTDNRILGKKQDELVNILKVGLDLEQRFGQKFFSYIRNFNGKNSKKINYAEFFSDIKKLEQLQSQASVLLKTNVFQVPDNSNNISAPGLEDIIGELLRNQIAVLFDPVPFKNNTALEPLRLAFINYNKLEPQKFQNSCLLK